MATLLGGGIAKIVHGALSGIMRDITIKNNPLLSNSTSTPWNGELGKTTYYTFKGFLSDFSAYQKDGTIIQMHDKKVVLLAYGAGIVPTPDMKVIVDGLEYNIVSVQTDPATATHTLQVRQG